MANIHSSENLTVRDPGTYTIPSALRTLFIVFALIGVLAFGAGLAVDSKRAWYSFLMGHFFFFTLALGGTFFAVIQWITSAMWSAPVRRIAEALASYLPVSIIAFIILCFGMKDLYIWTHPDHVIGDILLEGKTAYLNIPFFIIRNLVIMGAFAWISQKMVSNSIAQDKTGDQALTLKNRFLSPIFLILFTLGYTMVSFDLLMSLDPHWFSTMFGVYTFAGLFYSVLALICIIAVLLRRNGKLTGIVNDNHLHDLGKFMFAFTIFWAYIGFSQYMLIWYANLPEETGYFLTRMSGGWFWVSCFLLVGKFAVPMFFLLPRDAKRNERVLLGVGTFMLIAQWIDNLWLIQPQLFKSGPSVGWMEIGVTLGFAGVFGLTVSRFLSKHTIVAIGDPRLAESVHHHHQ